MRDDGSFLFFVFACHGRNALFAQCLVLWPVMWIISVRDDVEGDGARGHVVRVVAFHTSPVSGNLLSNMVFHIVNNA